jgi:hypothetical protein
VSDEAKPKHAGGRPTKYKAEWVELLPGMFAEGQSVLEVAVTLGISRAEYYELEKRYPEFMDASTRGKGISQAWWESQGRVNLFDTKGYDSETKVSIERKFNDRLWNKNVSCRFRNDWTDKSEIDLTTGPLEIKVTHDTEGI